ncbi:hypothetical protein LTR70_006677 [Exophiala xenobiotica]|nr:hypothetical protein LTR70_006677 [Exophiala xenobiotica]
MADDNTNARNLLDQTNVSGEVKRTPVQLEFPTIALVTSFESLLSNSATSSQGTIIMPLSQTTPALDESWASLDASDYSRDDDLQSENTDSASLVDLSSTNDTESATGDETASDADLDEDRATSMIVAQSTIGREEKACEELQGDDGHMEDTIILQRSEIQPHPDTIDLEYSRLIPSPPSNEQHGSNLPAQEIIEMTVSKSSLVMSSKPFSIAYYGAASAHEAKSELLGKIGAALVTSSTLGNSQTPAASPCFNIVATEFGPGSKPAFADLIPSQAQMTVDDIVLLRPTPKSSASIRLAFKGGMAFESNPKAARAQSATEPWRPDLFVVQICREDLADDFFTVSEALELARRHFWPVIVVTNAPTNGLCPLDFENGITVRRQEGDVQQYRQPIDLDSFVEIDSDQLNHHIRHVITKAQGRRTTAAAQMEPASLLHNLARAIFSRGDGGNFNVGNYTLQSVEAAGKPVEKPVSFLEGLQQTWSVLDGRQLLKDSLLTIAIVLLGVYVMTFSQNVSHTIKGTQESNTTAITPQDTVSTAAVAALPSEITEILSTEHDLVVYDPISFDQMWNRLTGRPARAEERAVVEECQQKVQDSIKPADPLARLRDDAVYHFISKWRSILINPARNANELFKKGTARRRELREKRERQIHDMHRKLEEFWSDVSRNVQGVGMHTQEYFGKLVDRSRQHLQDMSRANEQRLEKLVSEQKDILGRAQTQARLLAQQPKRKKRSFF